MVGGGGWTWEWWGGWCWGRRSFSGDERKQDRHIPNEVLDESRMLRRRTRTEVFAALFFEAGRDCAGWDGRDAGVSEARGGGYPYAEQETACCAVPARGSGRGELRSSSL